MKRAFLLLFFLLVVSSVSAENLTDGLLAAYTFNNDSAPDAGSVTWAVNGASHLSSGCALDSGCYEFDGLNDFLDYGGELFVGDNSFSISFVTVVDTFQTDGDAGTGNEAFLWQTDGCGGSEGFYVAPQRSATNELAFTTTYVGLYTPFELVNATEYHIVLTYNGSVKKIFVNGVEAASGLYSNVIGATSDDLTMGRGGGTCGYSFQYFDGWIDEVYFWDYGLSDDLAISLFGDGDYCLWPFTDCEEAVEVVPVASSPGKTRYIVNEDGVVVGVQYAGTPVMLPEESSKGSFLSLAGGERFDFNAWFSGLIERFKGVFSK